MATGPRGPSWAEMDLWGQLEEKGVGAGEEHTQLFLSLPFCLVEYAPWTGLGGIGSLRLGGMKRRIV